MEEKEAERARDRKRHEEKMRKQGKVVVSRIKMAITEDRQRTRRRLSPGRPGGTSPRGSQEARRRGAADQEGYAPALPLEKEEKDKQSFLVWGEQPLESLGQEEMEDRLENDPSIYRILLTF